MVAQIPDILAKIIQHKVAEVAERAALVPLDAVKIHAVNAAGPRGFVDAIRQRIEQDAVAVIAEIKKASPSQGLIRRDFSPAAIASGYAAAGACCLSVLTDSHFFQGANRDLEAARAACRLPVLRKDFIVDPYQVWEARGIGADCILLIVAALDNAQLKRLMDLAADLNMDVLVEVHDRSELERILPLNAPLIGINNRDLRTFETRLDTTLGLLRDIPGDRIVVTESGIHTEQDVALMKDNGVRSFLVGEALMRGDDPGTALTQLFFQTVTP